MAETIAIDDPHVLVKNGLFYRPNYRGYTSQLIYAGVYSCEDARKHASNTDSVRADSLAAYMPELNETIEKAERGLEQLKSARRNLEAQLSPIEHPKTGEK